MHGHGCVQRWLLPRVPSPSRPRMSRQRVHAPCTCRAGGSCGSRAAARPRFRASAARQRRCRQRGFLGRWCRACRQRRLQQCWQVRAARAHSEAASCTHGLQQRGPDCRALLAPRRPAADRRAPGWRVCGGQRPRRRQRGLVCVQRHPNTGRADGSARAADHQPAAGCHRLAGQHARKWLRHLLFQQPQQAAPGSRVAVLCHICSLVPTTWHA